SSAAPILTGSHLDSQPTGGKFDGAFGVLAGFEVLEAMQQAGVTTRRPVELVCWSNEEGSRFQPGCMGSSVFTGKRQLNEFLLDAEKAGTGGGAPREERVAAPRAGAGRAFVLGGAPSPEAHMEQGPFLGAAAIPMGAVIGGRGPRRYTVDVHGEEAHAGTAPL